MSEPPTTLHRAKAHDVLEAARSWLDKDGRIALATVVGRALRNYLALAPDELAADLASAMAFFRTDLIAASIWSS